MSNINFVLTEREVCTEKYRTEVFLAQNLRARSVRKDRGPIFFCTNQASEVNKKFIIWRLAFRTQTKNCKTETNKEY